MICRKSIPWSKVNDIVVIASVWLLKMGETIIDRDFSDVGVIVRYTACISH